MDHLLLSCSREAKKLQFKILVCAAICLSAIYLCNLHKELAFLLSFEMMNCGGHTAVQLIIVLSDV